MYSTLGQASLMTWHINNRSGDGMVRHVTNSKQWRFIDEKWLDFASEPHNIHLGLATDGINPFVEKHSTWSTWPVTFLNYNLPPWLTIEKHFLMLSLIIPGEE
jgi:hypothetical protein